MRETLEALVTLIREYPVRVGLVIVATVAMTWQVGNWILAADACHAQARTTQQIADSNVVAIEGLIQMKKDEALKQAAASEKMREMCTARLVTDRVECAKVGIVLE